MHASVMEWLTAISLQFGDISAWSVLEVGSYDENGSPRDVFKDACHYVGVDQREGRGVDRVAYADALPFGSHSFDLVVSTEMLEHDPTPWLSLPEMARVLVKGGHLLLTARGFGPYGGYPEHPCPEDYWRFNERSFGVLHRLAGLDIVEMRPDVGQEAPGVFAHAIKP